MTSTTNWKTKLAAFLLGILFTFFILVYLEHHLRRAGFHFDPWRHYTRFGQNFEGDEITYYARDKELFWKFRPSQVISTWWVDRASINALGFRGPELIESPPANLFRILCLGDSGTFGWDVLDNETYPYYLQKLITEKLAVRTEVVNAGVPGYSSHQGLASLKKVVDKINPSMVIFCYGMNDQNPNVFSTDKNRKNANQWLLTIQNHLFKYRTYQLIYKEATLFQFRRNESKFMGGEKQVQRVPLPDFENNIKAAIELCASRNIKLIFLPRSTDARYRDMTKQIALEQGAGFVDIEKHSGDPLIKQFLNGDHPPAEGYFRLAELVFQQVANFVQPQQR